MKKYILLFVLIFVLGVGLYTAPQMYSVKPLPAAAATSTSTLVTETRSPTTTTKTVQITVMKLVQAPNVTIVVASTSYPVYAAAGSNVIDAMQALASSTAFHFTSHEYSGLGKFVDSINGKENSNGYYWFLYVNGKSSELGASQTTLKSGDVIEWRYEKNY